MRKFFGILLLTLLVSCATKMDKPVEKSKITSIKPQKNNDGEWDLDVMDSEWSYFLNAVARPVSQYSESYLKARNAILVSEWNVLYYAGKYRDIIESSIEYDPAEKYGLNFEYKLFQVFAYVRWKYGLRLNGLPMSEEFR